MGFRLFLAFCFFFLSGLAADTSPPAHLPVIVETSFYLDDLIYIEDKAEVFTADITLRFKWNDPRLAFPSDKPLTYLENAVPSKLQEMWWPQIEFVSTDFPPVYDNQSLFIFPDGAVEYIIGLTGKFRTPLNFASFPFDTQTLKIGIDSFVWDKNILRFAATATPVVYSIENMVIHKEADVLKVEGKASIGPGPVYERLGGTSEFSTYEVSIVVKRKYGFYVYQVFVPLLIVLGISFAVFFDFTALLLAKVAFTLTAFLVFVAAKFAINQDLPRIGYMTMIDKVFVLCYICFGVTVFVNILEKIWRPHHETKAQKLNQHARWALPLLFVIALVWIFVSTV